MRFLIDMNLTPRWVSFLGECGHEAVHWSSVGDPGAKDSQICLLAKQNSLVLLTNDLDFPQIMAYTRDSKPSVILLRGQPLTPEARGSDLLDAMGRC